MQQRLEFRQPCVVIRSEGGLGAQRLDKSGAGVLGKHRSGSVLDVHWCNTLAVSATFLDVSRIHL